MYLDSTSCRCCTFCIPGSSDRQDGQSLFLHWSVFASLSLHTTNSNTSCRIAEVLDVQQQHSSIEKADISTVCPTRFRTLHFFNLLKPTGHVMHQRFNIQQLYVLPTLYLCVLYLSENKQRLVSLTA